MNQNLLNFFEDISKDQEKLKKLFSYQDLDKMYEYAISESKSNFTKEEFEEGLGSIVDLSERIESGEISKEDLESGKIDEEVLSKVSGGVDETVHRSVVLGIAAILPFALGAWKLIKDSIDERKKRKALAAYKNTPEYKEQVAAAKRQAEADRLKTEATIKMYKTELGENAK